MSINAINSISSGHADFLDATPLPPLPSFPFPWEGLEHFVSEAPGQHLPLVGYGSLLKLSSAGRTMRNAETSRRTCLAFGCRRIFNYEMPERVLVRYGASPSSLSRAALNVLVTGDYRDVINGVLITVKASDLEALREREFGYDLLPVFYLPWNANGDNLLEAAYVLSAPETASDPNYQVVRRDILPQEDYARLCEEGAAEHSPEFLSSYLRSTYLADKTSLWKP